MYNVILFNFILDYYVCLRIKIYNCLHFFKTFFCFFGLKVMEEVLLLVALGITEDGENAEKLICK